MRVQDQVLFYLIDNPDGLTVTECRELFGTTELRAIVAHAAKRGHVFDKEWETGLNRYGQKTRWLRYKYVKFEGEHNG